MTTTLILQTTSEQKALPTLAKLQTWVDATMTHLSADKAKESLTLRIVDKVESAALNEQFRHKKGPTNVLSFQDDPPPGVETDSLGDLAICAPLVATEAAAQDKTFESHFAHLVVHGILHLAGYDHASDEAAIVMEALETKILESLGHANPY